MENKYDIKPIKKWRSPLVDGAPLLTMPNIPQALFGCAPRVYMSKTAWDLMRKKCYMEANYKCQACGRYLGHGRCHCHECYTIDYKKAVSEFARPICLCPECHTVMIHSGRALTLFKNGDPQMDLMRMLTAVQRGFKLIQVWNRQHPTEEPLRVSDTFLEWAKQPELADDMERFFQIYEVKFYTAKEPKGWRKWKLRIGDKVYDSPYRTYEDWAEKYIKPMAESLDNNKPLAYNEDM